MSNAPVCHISTGSQPIRQPRATLLPTVPTPVDLPSAIAAINQLKILIQMLAGQQAVTGPRGFAGLPGVGGGGIGGGGISGGGSSTAGAPGAAGQKGKDAKKGGRFVEDRGQRAEKKIRVFQDNDKDSDNYVDIMQIDAVVWVDTVTGETITWSR